MKSNCLIFLFLFSIIYADLIVFNDGIENNGKITKVTDSALYFIKIGNVQEVMLPRSMIKRYEIRNIDAPLNSSTNIVADKQELEANYFACRNSKNIGLYVGGAGIILSLIGSAYLQKSSTEFEMGGMGDALIGLMGLGTGIICIGAGTVIVMINYPKEEYYRNKINNSLSLVISLRI